MGESDCEPDAVEISVGGIEMVAARRKDGVFGFCA